MDLPQDRYIVVEGYKIRYWQEGNAGDYLLLLHGINASIEYWHKNIFELAKHYRVVLLDLPGFGKSDKPNVIYDLNFFAEFVAKFCQALGIESMHLAAHSLGGAIGLQFALNNLPQIKKLVLADGVGFALQVIIFFRLMGRPIIGKILTNISKSIFTKALKTNVYDPAVITEELVNILYPLAHDSKTQKVVQYITKHNTDWQGILATTLQPLWHRFIELKDVPVLLIWGKQDNLLATDIHVPAAKKLIPHVKIELLDCCGHIPQLERPLEFNRLVIDFLGG
ncbi:MAG: hypothetical protein A3E87_03100 [Gammaproteobacteria bacterium RIFCSPHIGHO2_12_FULL_35_23]|nr:MAG: hypothetical protein A3E87_03100 [Gammaproteobacteria bacterium RIFCSPHIGHO2_12_FULL_35_23]